MFINKFKRKNEQDRKRERVIFMTTEAEDFSALVNPLSLYGLEVIVEYIKKEELTDFITQRLTGKSYFVIDGLAYQDEELTEISMILRGRAPSVLIGAEDSIEASCRAKDAGFTSYFIRNSEPKYIISEIVKHFGYQRSRTSMVIGLCNASADADISYRVFSDLRTSRLVEDYSTLFINCDVTNIYYDAALGIKSNKKTTELALAYENEVDVASALKLVNHVNNNFGYISFNTLGGEEIPQRLDVLMQGIEAVIDALSNSFGFIFINIPYYFLTIKGGMDILGGCDIRAVLINGQIESLYNFNFIRERSVFEIKNSTKNSDKLIAVRRCSSQQGSNITNSDIKNKFGIDANLSVQLNDEQRFFSLLRNSKKEQVNIIDEIIR